MSGGLGTGDYVEVARALRCLHFPGACVSLIDTVGAGLWAGGQWMCLEGPIPEGPLGSQRLWLESTRRRNLFGMFL